MTALPKESAMEVYDLFYYYNFVISTVKET